MKFWFANKKSPREVYDGKAPYDATVEQALRVAREVSTAPAEAEREMFDFGKAMRPSVAPASPKIAAPPATPATRAATNEAFSIPTTRTTISRTERAEMERRVADYRAFQIKLNEEREARVRRTMDNLRAKLQKSVQDNAPR
jgi:hypothetical protein